MKTALPLPAGDRDLFDRLARRDLERLERFARKYFVDPSEGMETAQEALARAWRAFSTYDRTRPFWPWIRRICERCALSRLRATRRRRVAPPHAPPRADERLRALIDDRELRESLERAIAALPAPLRAQAARPRTRGLGAVDRQRVRRFRARVSQALGLSGLRRGDAGRHVATLLALLSNVSAPPAP